MRSRWNRIRPFTFPDRLLPRSAPTAPPGAAAICFSARSETASQPIRHQCLLVSSAGWWEVFTRVVTQRQYVSNIDGVFRSRSRSRRRRRRASSTTTLTRGIFIRFNGPRHRDSRAPPTRSSRSYTRLSFVVVVDLPSRFFSLPSVFREMLMRAHTPPPPSTATTIAPSIVAKR